MATPWKDSAKFSIGKAPRKAQFVNPKIVTNVPGPGSHDPLDHFTTKQNSSMNWTICKNERHSP